MSCMNIVVVESPAKAKTINKYLGRDYKVIASYGHIRDLPAKDGSVLPDDDFTMSWEVDGKSEKHIRAIAERSEEHTSELQSQSNLVCRLLLEKKKKMYSADGTFISTLLIINVS